MKFRKAMGHYKFKDIYEMQLGKRWFFINEKNIVFNGDINLVRNLLNSCLIGLTCQVEGQYNKKAHKLVLRA